MFGQEAEGPHPDFYLDENGATIVPEHYWWCVECDALTPHRFLKPKEKTMPWREWECEVCGYEQSGLDMGCPNCGFPEPEDDPIKLTVVVHGPGCHFRHEDEEEFWESGLKHHTSGAPIAWVVMMQFERSWERMRRRMFPNNFWGGCETWTGADPGFRLNSALQNLIQREKERTCKCPRKVIYPLLNILNFTAWPAPHMDCMNATEWAYNVRCEKCGVWYDRQDGNC